MLVYEGLYIFLIDNNDNVTFDVLYLKEVSGNSFP